MGEQNAILQAIKNLQDENQHIRESLLKLGVEKPNEVKRRSPSPSKRQSGSSERVRSRSTLKQRK